MNVTQCESLLKQKQWNSFINRIFVTPQFSAITKRTWT